VNQFFLWFFTAAVAIHYLVASPLAVELSILSNFTLNNVWTFRHASAGVPLATRLARFHLAAAGGFVINYVVLIALHESTGLALPWANLIGILAAFLWNYTFNVRWTWRQPAQPPR
jgi:dolichol-phosphate mannosyltransferase